MVNEPVNGVACYADPRYFWDLWDEPGAVMVAYYPRGGAEITDCERLFFMEDL